MRLTAPRSTVLPPECDESERAGYDVSDGPTAFSLSCMSRAFSVNEDVLAVPDSVPEFFGCSSVLERFKCTALKLSRYCIRYGWPSVHLIWFKRCEWVANFAASN